MVIRLETAKGSPKIEGMSVGSPKRPTGSLNKHHPGASA